MCYNEVVGMQLCEAKHNNNCEQYLYPTVNLC